MKANALPFSLKPQYLFALLLCVGLVAGCSSARVTGTKDLGATPTTKPEIVYVANFDLDVENIKQGQSFIEPFGTGGPLRERLLGHSSNPQELADKLVDTMAGDIVEDLTKAGIPAARLTPGQPMPDSGWLVRGVFTEVNQGNQLQRAVIGMGMGQTDMQVVTTTDNLTNGLPKSFYEVDTTAQSGKGPGAAATVFITPYAVPVHFIMAHGDLKKNVKKTAEQIADSVKGKIEGAK